MTKRSLGQFRTNPLRTMLTLLGVVFGVGAVVAMMSIGEGAQRQILKQIEAMGATSIHITSKPMSDKELSSLVNDSTGLNRSDVHAIRRVMPQAKHIAYRAKHLLGVSDVPIPTHELHVLGISPKLLDVHNLRIEKGRPLTVVDHERAHRAVILGADVAKRAFPKGDAIGKTLRLDYSYFEVVGVLKSARAKQDSEQNKNAKGGNSPFGQNEEEDASSGFDKDVYERAILLPFETLTQELSPAPTYSELDLISVQVTTTAQTLPGKYTLDKLLTGLHGGIQDFEIIAPEEILRQKQATQTIFNAVLIAIAAISLLVGGIGVMNIMLANIMERISEIGLRRAIGARKRDIRNQFLLESIIICTVGGLLGIVSGFSLSYVVSIFVGLPIAFAWKSMVLSFFISLFVGVTFGLMPAVRAANINPIEALRAE